LRRHFRQPIATVLAFLFPLWTLQVRGATILYWDGDNNGTNSTIGGAGTWDISLNKWDPDAADNADGDNAIWNNANNDTAFFGGNAGEVALGSAITAGGLVFGSDGYVITGDTLTLAAASGLGSPTINVAAFSHATIASQISGSDGIAKTGNGTLFLTNNTNNYTGDTVINGGALVISNQSQLGSSTNTIAVTGIAQTGNPGYSGGQLVLNGVSSSGPVTMTRDISLGGRGPGAANASGALVSVGNNILNGNLTMASPASEARVTATHGITTINGNVQLGNSNAQLFYGSGNFIINGQVTGFDSVNNDRFIKNGNYFVTTTMWLNNNNNTFLQPLRIDTGTVRVSSNGALGLSGSGIDNFAVRSVDLNGGTLEIHTDAPDFATRKVYNRGTTGIIYTNRALGGTGLNQTVVFNRFDADNATFYHRGRDGYNLTLGGTTGLGTNMSWSGGANLNFRSESNGTLTLDMNIMHDSEATQRTLFLTGIGDMVLTGAFLANGLSNAMAVAKDGTGQLTLTNTATASTNTGATTINQGTLVYSSTNALSTGAINIGNASTTSGALTYAGAGETISRAINLNTTTANVFMNASGSGAVTYNGTFTAGTGNKTLILGGTNTGNISSALPTAGATLNVQKIGSGTWQLSGANLFTGSTTVSNGTLKIQDTFSGTSRNVLPDAGAIIFNTDVLSNTAGGIFQYLGDGANASTETVGALTSTAGHGVVEVVPGSGGSATLTFTSLGARTAGATLNVFGTGTVNVTGTAGFLNAGTYFDGSDFAFSGAGTTLRAAVYDTDAGFVTAGAALTAASHNLVTAGTSSGALTISSLKISGNQTVAQTGLLTIQTAANSAGGILQTGGSGIISGTGVTTGGTGDLVVRVDGVGDTLTMAAPITATTTGGLTKNGEGLLLLQGAQAYLGGATTINEGTLRIDTGSRLGGATASNNNNLVIRQAGTLDLFGNAIGVGAFNGAGGVTNSSGTAATLTIGNNNQAGYFTGLITGNVGITKAGTNTIHLTGMNTFSGPVTLNGGNLDVTRLANIGSASGIGTGDATSAATNAASLVFNGGTLRYVGTNAAGAVEATQTPSVSIDRLFTLAGSGAIRSFGSYGNLVQGRAANHAALIFNNTGPVVFSGAGTRTLTLGGDSLGDNEIALQLINNPNANEALTLIKNESGMWKLSNSANNYSGQTQIDAGALWAEGTALSVNSNLRLSGSGVLMTSGTFNRTLGTLANQVQWNTNQHGGFAASTDRLIVNLGGLGATLDWGTGGIGNGTGNLILSSSTSWADVDFQNGINLNGATRTVTVNDNGNTGLDYATISGVISNSTGTGALTKNGAGILILGNANTYNGNTTLSRTGRW
jgi:fibronectin-binding autotransporter adhesin